MVPVSHVVVHVPQRISFANKELKFTFAALPEFVNSRRTDNPRIVLLFALGIVVALACLFVLLAFYFHKRDAREMAAMLERRAHQERVATAAREAHEKTIAYACHQLR